VQALAAVDAIVHLTRDGGGRHVAQVAVLRDDGAGGMRSDLALVRGAGGDLEPAGAWPHLARRLDGGAWPGER